MLGLEAVYQTHQVTPGTMTAEAGSALHRAIERSRWQATLGGHADWVWHAAWSPDDTRIVTASADGSAKVWNAQTGKELFTLSGHTDPVNHAAWSADDRRIVTASSDGSGRIYFARIDGPGGLIEFACTRTGRNLTHDEWRRYMGSDVSYRETCPNLPVP